MIRKQHLLCKLILLSIVALSFSVGIASADIGNWVIDGDKVYVDDLNAYISATPHTLSGAGYVYFNVKPKTYSGSLDLYFGFNSLGIKPLSAEYYNNGNWNSITSNFKKANHEYDGFDLWYYAEDLPVGAGVNYNIRVWMEPANDIVSGKYGFGIKPSHETFSQAVSNGHFYYLDPWWNGDWDYKTESTVSNVEFPFQMNLTVHQGSGVNNATDIFMFSNVESDYSDLRFLLNDTTELSYWVADNTSSTTMVWINVTANGTVGCYYGNENASEGSNGKDTFILFNNGSSFDGTTPITKSGAGAPTWVIDNSTWKVSGTTEAFRYFNSSTGVDSYVVEAEMKPSSLNNDNIQHGFKYDSTMTNVERSYYRGLETASKFNVYSGLLANHDSGISDVMTTEWASWKLIKNGNTKSLYWEDVKRVEHTENFDGQYVATYFYDNGVGSSAWYKNIRVRSFAVTEPVWGVWGGQLPNTPPTTPVGVYPLNNSIVTEKGVMLNVTSTDAEGQPITYLFYGDDVDGSTAIGVNDSVNESTYNWTLSTYDVYYWKSIASDGINDSAVSNVFSFLYIPEPTLLTPANNSTIFVDYPPLTSTVLFTWEDLAAPQYHLMVAEDANFNVMAIDTHVDTYNSNPVLLVNKEYFWKVYSYDGTTYSNSSTVYSFNLTGNSSLTGSAIEGVVYQSNGDISAIPGAEVTIWNTTWSSSMVTGSNGYYVFENLNSGTVYNLQAKADRFIDSSIALVSAEADPVTQNFYLIDDLTDTEWWHYVQFTVQNIWGTKYSDVLCTVYEGDDVEYHVTGSTGSDGSVTFHLNQNVEYRITFIRSEGNISREITIYPKSEAYIIFVSTTADDWEEFDIPSSDVITIDITKNIYNINLAYINASYDDSLNETTSLKFYLNQTNSSDPANQTVISYHNAGATSSTTHSFSLTDYDGESYIVHIIIEHSTYGTIHKQYSVTFIDSNIVDGIPGWSFFYLAIFLMFITGGITKATKVEEGLLIICMEGWIFMISGWFNYYATTQIGVGLTIATIFAMIAYIKNRSGGVQ